MALQETRNVFASVEIQEYFKCNQGKSLCLSLACRKIGEGGYSFINSTYHHLMLVMCFVAVVNYLSIYSLKLVSAFISF